MRYTAIAEAGNALVHLLKSQMVPETLQNPDHIGLCSPADKGDFEIGLHLYDVKESEEVRSHEMVTVDASRQKYPPAYLTLFYMVTAYSNGDVKYRSEEEQRLLGRVIQVFHDYSVLDGGLLPAGGSETEPVVEMLPLSLEEKMRIWSVPNTAYKTSLFYKVGPIAVDSTKAKEARRVTDVSFSVRE